MRRLSIIAVIVVILGGIFWTFDFGKVVYEKQIVEVEKVVEVDTLEKRIKDAQEAKSDAIRDAGEKARASAETQMLESIELEVRTAYGKELDAKELELKKRQTSYWRDTANVKKLIRETFPEDPLVAVAVATCESGLNPKAYNPTNSNGSVDGGLWQINSVHDKQLQAMGLDKFNPEHATQFARMLYEKNGWNDWVCYTHGKIAMR